MSEIAAELLRDPNTTAVALYEAARRRLGDFLVWEPESIWLELEHQGIEVPVENRARLMAAQALRLIPSFYWDAVVFEKTAVAFDGQLPHPDILEEASPAQLAWAVVEAAWLLRHVNDYAWEFQHEPKAYAAVVLARAGFAVTPDDLGFAQHALDNQRHDDRLRDDVAARWSHVDRTQLAQLTLEETRMDVQIARLAAVELHVQSRRQDVERQLARLG